MSIGLVRIAYAVIMSIQRFVACDVVKNSLSKLGIRDLRVQERKKTGNASLCIQTAAGGGVRGAAGPLVAVLPRYTAIASYISVPLALDHTIKLSSFSSSPYITNSL